LKLLDCLVDLLDRGATHFLVNLALNPKTIGHDA
jgi:hypothetical protein